MDTSRKSVSGAADRAGRGRGSEISRAPWLRCAGDPDALDEADEGERLRGASTISQQTAKNLFLWGGRSFVRKGLEAYFTVLLELTWPKQRILEVYLNIAEFGDGVYGAQAAAQEFFHKPAAQLNAHEAALLASVLPNPKKLHADRPSAYVQRHADWIERQVRQLGGPAYLASADSTKSAVSASVRIVSMRPFARC